MTKFVKSAKKAVATFLFAGLGVTVANPVLDMDVAQWKLVVATGAGALINLAYRWSEAALKEPDSVSVAKGELMNFDSRSGS